MRVEAVVIVETVDALLELERRELGRDGHRANPLAGSRVNRDVGRRVAATLTTTVEGRHNDALFIGDDGHDAGLARRTRAHTTPPPMSVNNGRLKSPPNPLSWVTVTV
jgi:hypothetical protein